jgi:hypothetical protein
MSYNKFVGLLGGFDQLRAPDAPIIGAATPGNAQVSVAFTAPSNTGAGSITEFAVRAIASGVSSSGTGSSSPVTVTGLTNGTEYTFDVIATSDFGVSQYSQTVASTPSS